MVFHLSLYSPSRVVLHDSHLSKPAIINGGVPQGSVLGPLLFSLYCNNVKSFIYFCKIIEYADDTTLYNTGPSSETLSSNLNKDLGEIFKWFWTNKLTLNANKTECWHKTILDKIVKLRGKKTIRAICKAPYNAHTEPLFKHINQSLYKIQTSCSTDCLYENTALKKSSKIQVT